MNMDVEKGRNERRKRNRELRAVGRGGKRKRIKEDQSAKFET